MLQNKARLSTLIFIGILAVVALIIAFNAGQTRGRLAVRGELETVKSEMMIILSATPTQTPVPLIPTNSPTPTPSSSPSPSPTPTLTETPTESPTPTTTPASAQEWGDRYRQLAEAGLNSSTLVGFSSEQAQSLLRGIAQDQGLAFVPASYFELSSAPWAALVSPRTPQGAVLPMLFWLDPNDQNRVRGQLLSKELAHANEADQLTAMQAGVQAGTMRQDSLGRFHLLLVESAELTPKPNIYVLTQPQPGQDFVLLWSSANNPLWSIDSAGSQISLQEAEGVLLPDLVVSGILGDGNELRRQLAAPNIILEQAPFARQMATTRWRYMAQDDAARFGGAVQPGYNLQEAKLLPTPLTTLAYLLQYLRTQDLSNASNYTTRLDLLQQAFDLGISRPAIWLAYYVDDNGNQIFGSATSNTIRFFDNADRTRSFTALFETDANGNYRVASLEQAAVYEPTDIVTPAPPLPAEGAAVTPTPVIPTPANAPTGTVQSTPTGTATSTPTLTPTPTFTPSPTTPPTETPTIAPTEAPTPTFTASSTAPPTNTPTETATAAPTDTSTPPPTNTTSPYPIPAIPTDQAPLARAIVLHPPANLRAGPSVDFPSIGGLRSQIPVDLFGITEAGDWILMRINAPDDPQNGMIGWIASNLLQVTGDLAFLPRYYADGTPLVAPTATFTATPGTPTATATATTIPTPLVQAPVPQPVAQIVASPPDSDDQVLTVGGERIPADPLSPIPVTSSDGQTGTLTIDTAVVEIWSGLFGDYPGRWVASPPELLWPGSELYVKGGPTADDSSHLVATRVRIAAAPQQPRAQLLTMADLASAVADGRAVAMLGSREDTGVYLLSTDATLRQLYTDENNSGWAGSDPAAGIIVSTQDAPTGKNRFSWVRGDGIGVQIFAQPFHSVRGVVADVLGGLWWVETPQADLDLWQLWHYDPASGSVKLELRGAGAIFQGASSLVQPALTPILLAAYPSFDGTQGRITDVTLLLDSMSKQNQTLYTGVFRVNVHLNTDQPGDVNGAAQLLLTPEGYRGPLQISPDRSKLAYFVYDPNQPSLTSGFIKPANLLRVLTLEGRGASTIRTVYTTDNRFEFLAPNLEWQGNDRLVIARSRFAPGSTFGIQRFGLVQVQLPPADQPTGAVTIRSYLLPVQRELRDYATCQDGKHTLTIATLEDGNLELARWDGGDQPQAIFLLPPNMSRAFLCWQAPDSLATR